jgi:16S rRNA (cytidine1402-2'-O)-methyltransferase
VPGKLYVIATPLGNLDDLSPRAVTALRGADCIACEDTRRTAKLLAHYGIKVPTLSCHRFNERARLDAILGRLLDGADVALVSDGGTPGIADPGRLLVRAAQRSGIEVTPIPGPSAAAALLSVSGLPADRYVFEGFLPARAGDRRRRLRELAREGRTVVLFEAPHRIRQTLSDLAELLGSRPIVLGRELTKLHETILSGSAAEVARRLGDEPRGEITLALAPLDVSADRPRDERAERAREVWRAALERSAGDRRQALREAARTLAMKRAALYRYLAEIEEIDE